MRRAFSMLLLLCLAVPAMAQESETEAVCAVEATLNAWLVQTAKAPIRDLHPGLRKEVGNIQREFTKLCRTIPSEDDAASGKASGWLERADWVAVRLTGAVLHALEQPLTTEGRWNLRKVVFAEMDLQIALNRVRSLAYKAVQVHEVPIEVPGKCPQRPRYRAACNAALAGRVIMWQRDLQRLGRSVRAYDVRDAVLRLADSVYECTVVGTCEDTLDVRTLSWHAQLQGILKMDDRASEKASTSIRPQLESIATDMSVRLSASACN